jgi:hypothetical protein
MLESKTIKMKKLIVIILGLLMTSCVSQEKSRSTSELNKIVKKIAAKHDYELTYQVFLTEEDSNPLSLTLHNSTGYPTAIAGAIVEECYVELSKKEIYYDRFIVKDNQGVIVLDISQEEMKKVLKCKPTGQKIIKSLADKDFSSYTSDLDTNYFKSKDIELTQQFSKEKLGTNVGYLGFEVVRENDLLYCAYAAHIDSTMVGAIINLTDNNCKIFSLKFR